MRRKTVLIVDAVEYTPEEAAARLGGPPAWFAAALGEMDGWNRETARAGDPARAELAAGADALILSGSPRDAWSDEPETLAYLATVRGWMESGRPLLGVCHGHQIMARAAGATVARSPRGWEVGPTEITLTEEGRACPLFMDGDSPAAPDPQLYIESHQDAVLTVPPGAALLGGNEHTPVQVLAYGPRQFSVQFHPEFTPEILRSVWTLRRETVRHEVAFDLDAVLDQATPLPRSPELFHRFLRLI